jgi:hypothetical protein
LLENAPAALFRGNFRKNSLDRESREDQLALGRGTDLPTVNECSALKGIADKGRPPCCARFDRAVRQPSCVPVQEPIRHPRLIALVTITGRPP